MKKMGFDTELFYDGPLPDDWKKRTNSNIPVNRLPFGFPPSIDKIKKLEKLTRQLKTFDAVLVHHHIDPFLAYYLTVFLKANLVWYCGEPLRALWENQLSGITSRELSSTIRPTSTECYGKSLTDVFLSNVMYEPSINFLRAIDKKTAKRYTKIIVNSNYTGKLIKSLYNLNSHVAVAYPGIEIGQQNTNYESYSPKEYILAIGAMIPMKNHVNLLRAYRRLPDDYRSAVKLVIIGDGPLKKKIQLLADEMGLSNLIFQEHLNEKELSTHYKSCKFIVHLALHEPFGLVPVEAALFGKPSIVSNQGGTKEFIEHGDNGFLVNPNDPDDVARQMKCLIDDEQLTAKMGLKAKERALKEFSIERSTEKILEELEHLT